jgi:biopolymer transport protein TolR
MARTFRRHHASHPISDLNVTNLVDLAFVLLIIFMIATPLITQEQTIPVNLPVESKNDQPKPDKDTKFVTVTIDAKGNYYLDNVQLSFRDLGLRLRTLGAGPDAKNIVVSIRADLTQQWQKIVSLMDELKKNNLGRVSFPTQAAD